jgi:hypothetical protein
MVNSFDIDAFLSPWRDWLPWVIGALAGVLVVAGLQLCRRRPGDPAAAPAEKPPPLDPFIFGSVREQRQAVRRKGNPVSVMISDATGRAAPWEGVVWDRSLGGLGLMVHNPVAVGTILSVRPAQASTVIPWVQVEVRSCRQKGDSWNLGCQYVKVPHSSLLWQFG